MENIDNDRVVTFDVVRPRLFGHFLHSTSQQLSSEATAMCYHQSKLLPFRNKTSDYATWFTARGAIRIALRQLWQTWKLHHWWRHNLETIRDREKQTQPRPMKSSELSNGENCIALRQVLQNRKLRHLWRHNLGSRWKLQKMAWENFSIGAFYNITENQHSPIKTVGWDSFLSPKPLKIQVFRGDAAPKGCTAPIF